MALPVLDGNQSATTLSSVVTGGEHIVAHSVVSLGTTAISNINSAVSGSAVTIPGLARLSNSIASDGTADANLDFIKIGGHQDGQNQVAHIVHVSAGGAMKVDASGSSVTFSQAPVTFGAITGSASILNFPSTQTIAGTVTANNLPLVGENFSSTTLGAVRSALYIKDTLGGSGFVGIGNDADEGLPVRVNGAALPISGTVTANLGGYSQTAVSYSGSSVTAIPVALQTNGVYGGTLLAYNGANTYLRVGLDAVGPNSLAFGGSVPISGTVTVGNSVTIGSLPAISGTVTANGFDFNNSTYNPIPIAPFDETVGGGKAVVAKIIDDSGSGLNFSAGVPISGTVTANGYDISSGDGHPIPLVHWDEVAGDGKAVVVKVLDANGTNLNFNTAFTVAGTVTANVVGTRTFLDPNAVTVSGFLAVGGWDAVNSQHAPIPLTDGGTGVRIGFDDTTGSPLQVINHPSIPLSATVTVGSSVTIGSLPAISGTVTANAGSGTFNVSDRGTTGVATVTSITATTSVTLMANNSNRKLLTIYNEGAGNLHVLYGSGTASTTNYSVKLFSGDYLEIDKYTGQVNAIFATAGTARVTEIT